MKLLTGQEVEKMSEDKLKETGFDIFLHGMISIKPEGWLYPAVTPKWLDKIYNMKFRPDDILVTTFPKCGTTWVQEIIWTMLFNTTFDNPKAQESLWLRSMELSLDMMFDLKPLGGKAHETYQAAFDELCPGKDENEGVCLQLAEVMPSPRILKSHYPLSLLPKDILEKIKVVYVVRNPKDMAVSLFHFFNVVNVLPFQSGMESLFKALVRNDTLYSPFWPHVKEAWEKRHHPNLLFLFYEDMKADIMKELGRLNKFLGTNLSKETLEGVAKYTSFSSMKARGEPIKDSVIFEKNGESEGTFFRKGKTGDWRNNFSPEMEKEFDQWIKENVAGTDLPLSWALGH